MKKILMYLAILFCIACAHMLQSAVGCMDNSKHLDLSDGYDYKTYHYVECACPCARYDSTFKRGRCARCLHFHVPQPYVIIGYDSTCLDYEKEDTMCQPYSTRMATQCLHSTKYR